MSTTRKSAVNSYRLVWGLWIALSLVYTAGYWHLAVLSGRTLQGCVLASAFLIQALLVPAYIWREQFSSGARAAIQAASAAVSIVGIPAIFLALTESSFRPAGLNLHYQFRVYNHVWSSIWVCHHDPGTERHCRRNIPGSSAMAHPASRGATSDL